MRSCDLRTELYRLRLPIYQVASQVKVHPSRLSLYLNGRLPMPPELRNRLEAIVAMHGIGLEQSDGDGS
jgi:hypothetical protein